MEKGTGDVIDVMPGSDGLGFWVIFEKNSELRFEAGRSELRFEARRGQLDLRNALRVVGVRWNC